MAQDEIAAILHERGFRTGKGLPLTGKRVTRIRQMYNLKTRKARLMDQGLLTIDQVAETLGVGTQRVTRLRQRGTLGLEAVATSDSGDFLYVPAEPVIEPIEQAVT